MQKPPQPQTPDTRQTAAGAPVTQEQDPEGILPPKSVQPGVNTQKTPVSKASVERKRIIRRRLFIVFLMLVAVMVIASFAPR